MLYNYSFEVAAAIIMFLLIFISIANPNFELPKTRAFFSFLCASFFETLLNILSSWGLANPQLVSNYGNQWLCFLFFISEAFTSILFFRYIVNLCEPSRQKRTRYAILALIPFGIFMVMIITNKFFHLVYKIENNVYTQGPMSWYGYLYIGLFMVASFLVATTARKTIRGRNRYAVLMAATVSLLAIIIQYGIKTVLLTGFSNAIVLTMFYIVIQNTNELNDRISGVRNNRAFYLQFESRLNQERPFSVLTIDIHQPIQINVLYGYRNGNTILAEVGEYLSKLAGAGNTFQITANVFALILMDEKEVISIRNEIEERFNHPWSSENVDIMLPANMSLIRYPDDVESTKEFLGLHYFTKSILRNDPLLSYLEMSQEIKDKYIRTSQVDEALKRALVNKSIQVYFQPIYNNREKKFTSLEALARMFDSELGTIYPDEFISRAESNGMIIPLDLLVLEKTCEFIANKLIPNKDRFAVETVHVNISALQCMQPNMDIKILSIIDSYKVPRNMIVLEITERAAVTAAELMQKQMLSLKEQGIRFALDDYGTGNSNCSYLINYPFDKVKFDKSMVWAYFQNETGKLILDGEIRTIHRLNIPIVAEGVETDEHLEKMRELNVESIQGYYYSKPLAPADLMDFLYQQDRGTI